eukprot:g2078.t1
MCAYVVRVRTKDGVKTIRHGSKPATFGELREIVASAVGADGTPLPASSLTLRFGFPPVTCAHAPGDANPVCHGETITVMVGEASPNKKAQSAKPKKRKAPPPSKSATRPNSAMKKRKKSSTSSAAASRSKSRKTGIHSLSSGKKRRRPRKSVILKDKSDVEQKLLSSLSSAGKGDVTSQFFRAASRTAVVLAYERTRALKRHIAAMKGDYAFEEIATARRLGDGAATKMKVKFRKGPRSFDEESVDILSAEEIVAALTSILESGDAGALEQMKPINMSNCSPRVFWNLVRNHHNSNVGKPTDVVSVLHAMFPTADLSFLYSRPKKMSSKARENKRQAEAHLARKVAAEARRRERLAIRKAKIASNALSKDNDGSSSSSSALSDTSANEGVLETVADITGESVAALLLPLGIKTIDDLADQEIGKLVMQSRELQRDQMSTFIEDARQDVILRCLGAIVNAKADDEGNRFGTNISAAGSTSEEQQKLPLLDTDTIPLVCALQDAHIVAPRDLTLHRTDDIVERIQKVFEGYRERGQPIPSVDVTHSLVSSWRMASWIHLGSRPWLTDYYAGEEE